MPYCHQDAQHLFDVFPSKHFAKASADFLLVDDPIERPPLVIQQFVKECNYVHIVFHEDQHSFVSEQQ